MPGSLIVAGDVAGRPAVGLYAPPVHPVRTAAVQGLLSGDDVDQLDVACQLVLLAEAERFRRYRRAPASILRRTRASASSRGRRLSNSRAGRFPCAGGGRRRRFRRAASRRAHTWAVAGVLCLWSQWITGGHQRPPEYQTTAHRYRVAARMASRDDRHSPVAGSGSVQPGPWSPSRSQWQVVTAPPEPMASGRRTGRRRRRPARAGPAQVLRGRRGPAGGLLRHGPLRSAVRSDPGWPPRARRPRPASWLCGAAGHRVRSAQDGMNWCACRVTAWCARSSTRIPGCCRTFACSTSAAPDGIPGTDGLSARR